MDSWRISSSSPLSSVLSRTMSLVRSEGLSTVSVCSTATSSGMVLMSKLGLVSIFSGSVMDS
eukprot:1814143-Alexandrium_andersonii.AAC.1